MELKTLDSQTGGDRSNQPVFKDRLMLAILGVGVGLTVLIALITLFWGAGPVIVEIPWFIPMVSTFISLTALCVTFLALGRYLMLRDPISFWTGVGFAGFGIGQLFYALTWPDLLPGGRSIIGQLSNTPAWMIQVAATILGVSLLVAALSPAVGGKALAGRRWIWIVTSWIALVTAVSVCLVIFERYLAVMVRPDGTYSLSLIIWNASLLVLFAVGTFFSIRRYRRSGDALPGYLAFSQLTFVFGVLMTITSGQRYDLLWYVSRMVVVGGYLVLLFGLLGEYILLFQRERESEARYRIAVMNASAVYAQTDRELRYRWIHNPHPDFRASEVIGKRDDELDDSEDTRRLVALKRKALEGGVGLREEVIFHRSDGVHTYDMTIEPLRDPDGQVVGVTTAALDITERVRMEAALRKSEERFRQLADAMPQLVWTAQPDGTVDYYNQRYLEYEGISSDMGEAWGWSAVVHPEDVLPTVDAWKHSVETGEVYQIEHRVRMTDGEFRWHLSRGVPVCDESGQVTKWFGTATDIHEVKQAEQALQKYTEELERSNRDLQDFAFVASHDLHEPLRKIEAFGDAVLEQSANLTDQQRDYLARMRGSANRMRSMVDGLLQLSRLSTRAQPFQPVDLARVIAEVLSDLDVQIQHSGSIVEVGEMPIIEADPQQMRSLLQNLIGNALKFQTVEIKPHVKISCQRPSPAYVQIWVEDNGIGFDEAHAAHLFEPFKRLVRKADFEGSGMGLAIARKIAERHGGSITAQSKRGQGAIFIVTLPIRQTHSRNRRGHQTP